MEVLQDSERELEVTEKEGSVASCALSSYQTELVLLFSCCSFLTFVGLFVFHACCIIKMHLYNNCNVLSWRSERSECSHTDR